MVMKSTKELRKFVAPEIITGVDARLLVGRYIEHFESKKPLIVTDGDIPSMDWFADILKKIEERTESYVIFCGVSCNPKDSEVMQGAEIFIKSGCDLIIAVGGGSPMDCAKGISIVSTNGGHILQYEGVDRIDQPGPPLLCIPTTAGSSADVSQFAIIVDTALGTKKAIISKKAVPDLALIDPIPLLTMDSHLTACTAMDAMTHAIEAFVSTAHSDLTDVHALEAIRLIAGNIESTVKSPLMIDSIYPIMLASLHAGLAFSNASLGAVHALSHSLGGLLDLPHGECNSILLAPVVDANFECSNDRYKIIAHAMGIDTDMIESEQIKEMLLKRINGIRKALGIADSFQINNFSDIADKLICNALNDPCIITNPKIMDSQDVKRIYEQVVRTKVIA